jgi:hypothetical protein
MFKYIKPILPALSGGTVGLLCYNEALCYSKTTQIAEKNITDPNVKKSIIKRYNTMSRFGVDMSHNKKLYKL